MVGLGAAVRPLASSGIHPKIVYNMRVATMTMLPALQAASSVGVDAPDEPRFSLVDGRYHESEHAGNGEGTAQAGTALALRGIAALSVQRGKPLCSIPQGNGWTRRHHMGCRSWEAGNSWRS